MGMIKDLWDVGKDIFSLRSSLRIQDKKKRETLSLLFLHIGEVLNDTYEKLSNNTYPHGNCEQLDLFSAELYLQTKDVIGVEKALALSTKLKQAHKVELLFHELSVGIVEKEELKLLDESSGYFIATAKLLEL